MDALSSSDSKRVQTVLGLLGIDHAGLKLQGTKLNTILVEVVKARRMSLITSPLSPEISQWLTTAGSVPKMASYLAQLNSWLTMRSFLVGSSVTLADYVVFQTLMDHMSTNGETLRANHPHLVRWYYHIQCISVGITNQVCVPSSSPLPVFKTAAAADTTTPPTASTAGAAAESSKGKDSKGVDKTNGAKVAAPAAAAVDDADPSKLLFLVGKVVKCYNHPDSEKLLVEEIDFGEAEPRTICSGIRAHYTAEQVEGRMVIAICNLKERAIAGTKSNGMVLCACNADHSKVALIEPAEGCNVGDKISFDGFTGEHATPAQVVKKKFLEKIAPDLRTNEKGVCLWRDKAFTLPSGKTATAALFSVSIS